MRQFLDLYIYNIHHEYLTIDKRDVLKPSVHIPPLPSPCTLPIIKLLCLSTHKKPALSQTHPQHQAPLVKVQMRTTFKSHQAEVNSRRTVVTCHFFPHQTGVFSTITTQPNCGCFSFQSSLEGNDGRCFKSISDVINNTIVCCAPVPADTHPRSIMSSPLPFDKHLLLVLGRISKL